MSSQSGASSLAILGLFLTLAFIIPGLVYVGALYVYFPTTRSLFSGFNSAVGLVIIAIAVGLIITSICFAIEWLIIRRIVSALGGQLPNIALLGELEARNVPTLYLNQVYGQYIMHFNIGLGVIIISTSYFLVGQINPAFVQGGQYAPYEILGGFFSYCKSLPGSFTLQTIFVDCRRIIYRSHLSEGRRGF